MAADLHIHILQGADEEDLKCFKSNTLGSKYFSFGYRCEYETKKEAVMKERSRKIGEKHNVPEGEIFYKDFPDAQKEWNMELQEIYKEYGVVCPHHDRISNTPNIWVGEVSWLKAGLFEDGDTFIPDAVGKISEIVSDDLPEIDGELIQRVADAMALPNNTTKEGGVYDGAGYSLANGDDIIAFLEQYKGERCFTVSW